MNLPAIFARILAHQAELAETLATDHQVTNYQRRKQLAEEIRLNAASFKAFVDQYRIDVTQRPCAAKTRKAPDRPHCELCAMAAAKRRKR